MVKSNRNNLPSHNSLDNRIVQSKSDNLKFLFQIKLEDFIPSYAHFGKGFDDEMFDIYHDEPENVFYRKKEFYENKLTDSEKKPDGPGIPLKTQNNISRFLSTKTLNDEMLLFHGVGSGKCVHPDTMIYVNEIHQRIEDVFKNNHTTISIDNISEEWSVPNRSLIVNSISPHNTVFEKEVKQLYRQYVVNEPMYTIEIETLNGTRSITTTGKHQFLTLSKWVPSHQLKVDDFIAISGSLLKHEQQGISRVFQHDKNLDAIFIQIKNIIPSFYTGYVYDLEVERYHNYSANGFVTHNTCSGVTIAELNRKTNPYLKPTLVLVKGGPLKRNFIRELATKCTPGQYIPDNFSALSKGEKIIRMNKLVSAHYEIHTFETFVKNIVNKGSDQFLKKEYSDRTILIDEVHNIRSQTKKRNSTHEVLDIYAGMHRFLHLLENRKIALLTATPMRDKPYEFAGVMNLILPLNSQLPTDKEFMEKFFDGDKIINLKSLKKAIRGRVSYVRSMETGVVKTFEGQVYGKMKKIKICPDKMSDFQTQGYLNAYQLDKGDVKKTGVDLNDIKETIDEEIDDEKKSQGLYDKSRQASLFVFPDGSYGGEGFRKYITENKNSYSLDAKFRDELTNGGKNTTSQIIKNISKYSSIYAATIKDIIDHPDENVFVYNKYVQGCGAILFSELLKLVGFSRTRGHIDMSETNEEDEPSLIKKSSIKSKPKKTSKNLKKEKSNWKQRVRFADKDDEKDDEESEEETDESENEDEKDSFKIADKREFGSKPRFAIITGETVSDVEVDRIIDGIFNHPDNKHGKYIQVIIGSQIIGEGKSLKNVRQIHVQTPHWNNSETEQGIGRGIRAFSFDDLAIEDRYSKIFRHAAIPKGNIESINYLMYLISENKDFQMKQIERICKETAVDCGLNKGRNRLPSDEDYSRECDYMKCDYKCDYEEDELADDEIITDTYNLFYAEKEIIQIVGIVKKLFKKRFVYDLTDLISKFQETPPVIVVRALKHIIDKSIQLTNRLGFPCFLREDHNLYFLVDEITLPSSFLLSHYTQHPNIKINYKFEDMIQIAQYRYIQDKINILENFNPNNAEDKKEILNQLNGFSPVIQEMFLEMAVVGDRSSSSDPEKSSLRKLILEHFRNFIVKIKERTISTLLQEDEDTLRCLPNSKTKYSDWYTCDNNLSEQLDNIKNEEKNNMKQNPYGYYGIITANTKKKKSHSFKIMLVEEDNTDKRKNRRGSVCMEMVPKKKIADIIGIINDKKDPENPTIGIPSGNEFNIPRNKMIDTLSQWLDKKELNEMSDKRLQTVYFWQIKAGKNMLCDNLEGWFKKNGLMSYE